MNTFIDLIGSYFIGGIVVVGIIAATLFFSSKRQETILSETSQKNALVLGEIIEHDFNKLGYRIDGSNKILQLDSTSIKFLSDLENDGVIDTVTYSLAAVNGVNNLTRRVGCAQGVTEWSSMVQNISIVGINAQGQPTSTISEVKSILFKLTLQEETPAYSEASIGAFWQRQFFPKNL